MYKIRQRISGSSNTSNVSVLGSCNINSPTKRYFNPSTQLCDNNCAAGCSDCSEGDLNFCFSCSTGYILAGNSCHSFEVYVIDLISLLSLLALIELTKIIQHFYSARKKKQQKVNPTE